MHSARQGYRARVHIRGRCGTKLPCVHRALCTPFNTMCVCVCVSQGANMVSEKTVPGLLIINFSFFIGMFLVAVLFGLVSDEVKRSFRCGHTHTHTHTHTHQHTHRVARSEHQMPCGRAFRDCQCIQPCLFSVFPVKRVLPRQFTSVFTPGTPAWPVPTTPCGPLAQVSRCSAPMEGQCCMPCLTACVSLTPPPHTHTGLYVTVAASRCGPQDTC